MKTKNLPLDQALAATAIAKVLLSLACLFCQTFVASCYTVSQFLAFLILFVLLLHPSQFSSTFSIKFFLISGNLQLYGVNVEQLQPCIHKNAGIFLGLTRYKQNESLPVILLFYD